MEDGKRRGRGGGRRGRGAGRGRGRGRGKKAARIMSSDDEANVPEEASVVENPQPMKVEVTNVETEPTTEVENLNKESLIKETAIAELDMEADISQLEAPTFTTISRSPPEPMVRLQWNHKVSLIGEKVLNPMIHCCDECLKPILVYGRMIPCKHIFCLKCARTEPVKVCPRCKEKVFRVEQSGLGSVFMCTFGGTRYGNAGCRRTYLSQRDLQAHINHRHLENPPPKPVPPPEPPKPNPNPSLTASNIRKSLESQNLASRQAGLLRGSNQSLSGRSNLINVPLGDQQFQSQEGSSNYYGNNQNQRGSGGSNQQFHNNSHSHYNQQQQPWNQQFYR